MLIKGIRSFSPDNQAVIEFYRPLTLIVAGETEVKAQIKLRFITGSGQPVVVIRSFQLTQRKASMAFKALDNVLQTVNRATGAREALSYRCADIDRVLPGLMGVSAAVLESVVFVHQEDSNWPLADTATVKRRFDDIFAATKYTRALEALRKLRTDKAGEAREMRLRLETLRARRRGGARLRARRRPRARPRAPRTRRAWPSWRAARTRRGASWSARGAAGRARGAGRARRAAARAQHRLLAEQNAAARVRLGTTYGEEDVGIGREELEDWAASLAPASQAAGADLERVRARIADAEARAGGARARARGRCSATRSSWRRARRWPPPCASATRSRAKPPSSCGWLRSVETWVVAAEN
ncbi:hypothetical protein QBZ16_000991 [Prototheca wickerhamii]|uniref:Uncharacterized protein n=1 Tax=Prototheca wickerhamii TaxID=3111 RepID=A0AAD9IF99_PROWI|nr:hypothetical protein QBZ16_000991 [Prototheca wickerhamii]